MKPSEMIHLHNVTAAWISQEIRRAGRLPEPQRTRVLLELRGRFLQLRRDAKKANLL